MITLVSVYSCKVQNKGTLLTFSEILYGVYDTTHSPCSFPSTLFLYFIQQISMVALQAVTEVLISPWGIMKSCKCVWDGNMHVEVKEGAEQLRPPGEFGMCPVSTPHWLRVKVNNWGRRYRPLPVLSHGAHFNTPPLPLGPTHWQTASLFDHYSSCFNGSTTPSDTHRYSFSDLYKFKNIKYMPF